jgi:hypothetical protein
VHSAGLLVLTLERDRISTIANGLFRLFAGPHQPSFLLPLAFVFTICEAFAPAYSLRAFCSQAMRVDLA